MTSKERVRNAIIHKSVDRVPAAFESVGNVSNRLKKHFGFSDDEELYERLGIDIRYVEPKLIKEFPQRINEKGNLVTTSFWGYEEEHHNFGDEHYTTTCTFPLDNISTIEEVESYSWPSTDWFDYSIVTKECEMHKDKAIVIGHEGAFQQVTYLISMDRFFMLMIDEPEVAQRLLDKIVDFELAHYRKIFEAGHGLVDILRTHDDYGTQISTLFSVEMWKQFFPQNIKRLVNLAHSFDAFYQQHSCGAIEPMISGLIDCGVDSLEPLQPTPGLFPEELAEKYGGKICFHGGIDTQDLLPHKGVNEVIVETKRYLKTLNNNGGYILMASQGFENDVPTENILALYDVDRKVQ